MATNHLYLKQISLSNLKFDDRTILLWTATNIGDTQQRKSLRVNVEFDHAVRIAWSPDNKALLIHKAIKNCIEVIRIEKKNSFLGNPSVALTFPSSHDSDVIVGFGISCNGRFIMTCSNKTDIILWNLKGQILDKLDTCLLNNWSAKISPCGRFIAACGFSPDVKIWEVKFNKSGEYQKTISAFNLSGHTSGIYDIAFDQDSSHVATISKDGTWKLFDVKIEYEMGQMPRCLVTGNYKSSSENRSMIALSPKGDVVAVANGNCVEIFFAHTGICDAVIEHVYEDVAINAILFDPLGKYFLTAGDRQVRVFHNVTGYKAELESAKKLIKSTVTEATRERLEQLTKTNEEFLKKFE